MYYVEITRNQCLLIEGHILLKYLSFKGKSEVLTLLNVLCDASTDICTVPELIMSNIKQIKYREY